MNDYEEWLAKAQDPAIHNALLALSQDEKQDAFYRDLEFGTGGLRGLLGAGSNRLNIYTVGKISQGIANYVNKNFKNGSVAISYDSRINSTLFAERAASVFAANGLKVFIYPALMPTPLLSYATRYLHCTMGVMITASHNPKEYNGYKVYNADGCQITLDAANEIASYFEALNAFKDVKAVDFKESLQKGHISYISEDCLATYLKYIQGKIIPSITSRDLKIVYTPLNGTGLVPVTKALANAGFGNLSVVKEQEYPDGNFTTCPKPNPELQDALRLGLRDLEAKHADVLIATDPDCDRCGTAVFHQGKVRIINGNEMGVLLFDFLLKFKPRFPKSVLVKTIVSTDMVFPMAKDAHIKVVEVLTGFKFIGEQIGFLEEKHEEKLFFMGFEESYGYLTGTEVRDKDAVDASIMIAQMFQYYKDLKKDPIDRLEELYQQYGYCVTALDNFEFKGQKGAEQMGALMDSLRAQIPSDLSRYEFINDYLAKTHYEGKRKEALDLPESNVLKYGLAGGSTITVRPSGTEPKLKVYYYITAKNEKDLPALLAEKQKEIRSIIAHFE
jgi:phosphoglucomutase